MASVKVSISPLFSIPVVILASFVMINAAQTAAPPSGSPSVEREILSAYKNGQYDRVAPLLEALPPGRELSRELLQAGLFSYLRLGKPEAAWKMYLRMFPDGRQDEPRWLRDVAYSFVVSRLRDRDEHVRVTAYTALAQNASREDIPLFEDGLLDSSILVRALAVEGLGRATAQAKRSERVEALGFLKRALDDPAPAVRIAALNALGDVGDRKDASLLDAITHLSETDEGAIQVFALAALVKLGRGEALADILSAATLPDSQARMAAVGVLGRLKRVASLPVLSRSIYDPDADVRAFAAGALGELGDPGAAAPLTHALADESPRVRGTAAASLGRLGLASVKPLLKEVARDPVELVRAGAIEGLLRLGDREAVLLAADLAKHPAPLIRSAVAQASGLSGNRHALPVLEQLLKDQQPQPRLTAALALGRLGDPAAVPMLKQALSDTDPAVRTAAAGSLAQVMSKRKSSG
jgi:HEAT repeat protein